MHRDNSRCAARSKRNCGTGLDSYDANIVWKSDVYQILNRVLERSLRRALDSVYQLASHATILLVDDDLDNAHIPLLCAIPACDERTKSLIRDALQLLEGIREQQPKEATDAEVADAVVGGGD